MNWRNELIDAAKPPAKAGERQPRNPQKYKDQEQPKMSTTQNQAADMMRLQFFHDLHLPSGLIYPDEMEVLGPVDWEELDESEQNAWIRAFRFAYKCGYNKGGDDAHAAQKQAFETASTGTHYDYLD